MLWGLPLLVTLPVSVSSVPALGALLKLVLLPALNPRWAERLPWEVSWEASWECSWGGACG